MLKPYDVVINGNATTQMLSDADAKARGLTAKAEPVEAVEPVKAVEQVEAVDTKAKTPANKARKPAANKSVEVAEQA